ncbi:hypothetical protein [Methanobacterium oryzae]|uniref:hypothetical protein n=1 Tax=Methanobacterium oryzae TaxID=69540 RepID=UPI003D19086E
MKNKLTSIIFLFAFTLIICNMASAANTNYTYTTDEDFNKCNTSGLNVSDDQIQLSDNSSSSAFPFIWIPNSNEGTVSKVNTITGLEIARYKTSNLTYGNPSRTTVDLDGSCWVGNRNIGTAVKIGLLENGGYIDRNHNGIIETSRDIDGNGVIMNTKDPVTGNDIIELLPWGEDECVLYEIILIPSKEGTYTPGEYKGPYANDYYNPGPRGLAIDSQNNVWIGTYGTQKYYYVNGSNGQILRIVNVTGHSPYGAVIDQYGILWSAGNTGNNILRLDPSNDSFLRINLSHTAYGLALDRNNHLFVSGLNYCRITRINILTGVIEWIKSAAYAQGLTVTDDGDIWSANNIQNTVTRYSNEGVIKATIIVGNTPSGVSVDNQGKIWVVDNGDEYIHRINPDIINSKDVQNGVELSKRIVGATHYGYSDMTGVISNTITSNRGIWIVIHDSEVNNALWGVISWNSLEPEGTKITVKARSSNDKINWSLWEDATNGALLNSTPRGRFLEIETTFERFKGSTSPVLYDLSVRSLSADITLINTLDNPTPKMGDTVIFITTVTNNGPDPATNLKIYPIIPAGFEPETPTMGYFENNIWIIDNLNPGEIAVLEIRGNIPPELTSRNIIYTASETHEEYDPTQISTASASFYVPVSNIELISGTKNGRPTLFIRNNGPEHAFNVGVQTSLPSRSVPTTSQGFYNNGLWYIGALAPGSNASLSLIFQPPNINKPVNPVAGYKKVIINGKYVYIKDYSEQNGTIPPPEDNSVPMQDTGIPLNFSGVAILFIFFAAYLNKNNDKIRPNKWLALFIILFLALLFIGNVGAADPNQTYNSSEDFDKGVYNNINGSGDKLELLNNTNPTGNYIWIPNTNQGTISKVDIRTGQEIARYRTSPLNYASPSRTVVDSNGNYWVTNYQTGSVVKIGLLENRGFIDRNHDGIIQTSRDLDLNGVITGTEILDWGKDECVLYETVFIPGREGNYTPGKYTGGYANNWANPGPLAIVIDLDGNVWVGCYGLMKYFCLDSSTDQIIKTIDVSSVGHTPYGAVIDQNGIIWSAGGQNRNILRLDTVTGSYTRINIPHWAYGLALDGNNHLFVTGYTDSRISRIDTLTGNVDWTKTAPRGARGVAVTDDGDVWTANLESDTVTRFSNDGTLKATIWAGNGPTALSVDGEGKLWTVDHEDVYIHRINPEINGVDFSKMIVSGTHVGYSNMLPLNSNTHEQGTWTVIHDSLVNNAYWGTISWNSYEPKRSKVTVRVRSSNDKINWSNWEEAINNANLRLTPSGRYLEVEVVLEKNGTYSPVVYDLTVKNLDSNAAAADLGVTITGDKNSLNLGEKVKLTITAFNDGPKSANVKVNYRIPFGLKLLSSQGQGVYDPGTGVWSVGILNKEGNATVELVLQAVNDGYFVNIVNVYGDLASIKTFNSKTNVRSLSVNAASETYDPDTGNNQAKFNFNSINPSAPGDNGNNYYYEFSRDVQPPDDPKVPPTQPEPQPPTPPKPPEKPDYGPLYPNDQLNRDVAAVRDALNRGEVRKPLPEWNLTLEEKIDEWETFSMMLDIAGELLFIGSISSTPGSGEYLQQVKSGMLEAMDSLKMATRYFIKDPRFAFNTLKRGFKQAGNSFVDDEFMKAWSKNTVRVDPNVAQYALEKGLCSIFSKQADKIRLLLNMVGSISYIADPLKIYKSWGEVVYSFAADGIGQGNYDKAVDEFWEALKNTFLPI